MPSEPMSWRDMHRDAPDFFASEAIQTGYPASLPRPPHLRVSRPDADADPYRGACTFLLANARHPGLQLVHGSVAFDGTRRATAWVELPDNLTYDGATLAFYRTDAYRDAGDVTVETVYATQEAARLLLETGHPGPWRMT